MMARVRKAIVFIVMGSFASAVLAADVLWTGAGDGATWNNAANWGSQRVPTAEDTAIFETSVTLTDTVNILGWMTVRNGAAVTAKDTVLGGCAGASARLLVTGKNSSFKSETVTIGCEAGGAGKLVTENGGAVFIDTKDRDGLVVATGAAPDEGDVIDVMEIGDAASRIAYLNNLSSYSARIRFMTATSKLNLSTSGSAWSQRPVKSRNWVFAAEAPAVVNVALPPSNDFAYYPLTVEGTGTFSLYGAGSVSPYYSYLMLLNAGGFRTEKGAPLVFSKQGVNMQRMMGQITVANALNVNGNEVFADGLTVESAGTLTATSADSFTFGNADRDGMLSANIPVDAPVRKIGAGMLTVSGPSSAGRFALAEGTLKVAAATSFSSLTMENGTTLVVDGADLTLGNLAQHGRVTVSIVNGGRIVSGGAQQYDILRPTLVGEFVKVGSGKMTIYEPASYPSMLHVADGELVFSKYGLAQRYWKWTFKGVSNGPTTLQSLGKVWLYGADDSRVGEFKYAAYGYNTDLTAKDSFKGKATWVCGPNATVSQVVPTEWHQDCFSKIDNLFSFGANANNFPNPGSPVIDKDDPDSYLGLEIRFRDDDPPITGYNFGLTTTGKGRPTDWTVEASDDGKTWTEVDVRSDVALPANSYGIFYDGTTYTTTAPDPSPAETFRFTGYMSEGLESLDTPIAIQVDGGAKLNLKAFSAGQEINALTYDAEYGCGEIVGAAFAENGTLYINASEVPRADAALPYVLTDCTNLENLKKWTVVFNGKATAWKVSAKNGAILVQKPGLLVVFR